MIKEVDSNSDELNDICEDCKKEDISVSQNLILIGFKIWYYNVYLKLKR